jgi:hypothetical protein
MFGKIDSKYIFGKQPTINNNPTKNAIQEEVREKTQRNFDSQTERSKKRR